MTLRCLLRFSCVLLFGFSVAWACAFDDTLREYLNARFWLPFAKKPGNFASSNVARLSAPFAGMGRSQEKTSLAKLRAAYQKAPPTEVDSDSAAPLQQALTAVLSAPSLTTREQEEVALLDAKIDLRAGSLDKAKTKLNKFLQTARTPEFLSEARGWLARAHYLAGEQAAAGKIYLNELNRSDSNLSRETLINSLRMTYGYNGGPALIEHLEEYFDTPEHAAFAIQLATNPRWNRISYWNEDSLSVVTEAPPYARIKSLLDRHRDLFRSEEGTGTLALLGMWTALRAGDPPAALRIAAAVPPHSLVRRDPDFAWMLASAHFLSRHYGGAERPLLLLFRSPRASDAQRAAAAYGLCGVYQKIRNPVEQIHFALWLNTHLRRNTTSLSVPSAIEDQSVYWAASGWDLAQVLDAEAPVTALRAFLRTYPHVPDVRLVQYSLAVRLARANEYEEAAQIYEAVSARRRAARMRQLVSLYRAASRTDLPAPEGAEAKYKMAEFLSANPDRLYFNDALWYGLQRYALFASRDARLTRQERLKLIADERKLKDDQEERWRAYLLLKEVAVQSGQTELGRKAAHLAIRCLRGISERFGRESEIRAADIELSRWLRHATQPASATGSRSAAEYASD